MKHFIYHFFFCYTRALKLFQGQVSKTEISIEAGAVSVRSRKRKFGFITLELASDVAIMPQLFCILS